ncbi:MAG: hypothetical protein PHX61_02735 [Alphaproteobacteria bacterium]|nr:hypothetical protein [Alphaproteobacteria bacterium]
MKWQYLLIGLLLIGCVANVGAWSDSLNNGDVTYTGSGLSGSVWNSSVVDTYNYLMGGSGNFIYTPVAGSSATYFAFSEKQSSSVTLFQFAFANATATKFYGWSTVISPGSAQTTMHRIEIIKSGNTVYTYLDGSLSRTLTPIPSTSIYSLGLLSSTSSADNWIDDISFGNSFTDTAIVSVMPHNWYILKNILSPSIVLQKDNNGNTIYSNHLNIQWSLGPQADGWTMATAPNSRYRIVVSDPTGAYCYDSYINITQTNSAVGIVNLTFNSTYLGSTPIQYGIYNVILYDGSAVKSTDYFSVIASGASVYWDKADYGNGDIATVTYSVSAGYWDTTNYDYSLKVVSLYGVTKSTNALTAQSGTVSVTLTDYDPGVYYAEIIATEKSTGTAYVMYYAATEVTAYVTFSGYVMNEENATVLSGANITVYQGTSNLSQLSTSTGAWNSSNNWLTGTSITVAATKTGYSAYSNTFTPVGSGNIALNISMAPTVHTYTGVAIGGTVSDTQYGNPISGATYHVRNTTEYTCTTNIAGYCHVNSLVNGAIYDVWSSKTGFGNSTVYKVTAVGI